MSIPDSSSPDEKLLPVYWLIPGSLTGWLPLLLYREDFWKFFYFMDEWDLIHKMDLLGYNQWVFGFFAENFVPVFKLLWSGLIFAGNGNYHVLLLAGFVNHMVIVFLVAFLMRMWGFSLFSILFTQCMVGLNYTHIEILSWTSQSSALMAFTSLLLVLIPFSKAYLEQRTIPWWVCGLISIISAAGALSFSRGVLNGAAIFGVCAVLWIMRDEKMRTTVRPALFALVPCVVIALVIAVWSYFHSANFQDSGNRLGLIFTHFLYRISLNPWYQQIRDLKISVSLSILLLQLNLLVAVLGIRWAKTRQRPFLLLLILFFLGDAMLLALGRNHLPIDTIPAWRYQYFTLVVFAPFVGIILEKAVRLIPFQYVRIVGFAFVLWWCSDHVFKPWKWHLPAWSQDRGIKARELLVSEQLDLQAHDISRFYQVINERSIELQKKYNLH